MVVVAYGLLLPVSVLDAPRLGCVNVHASLLPRWRGAAPIQRALLAGDTETGVCIMRMEAGLDTGPVYHRVATPIGQRDSGADLHDRLAELGAAALMDALPGIADGSLIPEAQAEDRVTYAHKLKKDESIIDWHQPAEIIGRMIRAYNPWPVAQTRLDTETLRVWAAEIEAERATQAVPGTVIGADKTGIEVAAGRGVVRILRLQPPGKRVMAAADFLNARSMDGVRLG
jgi:methionyl-tRNA formyltransferase